MQDRPARQRKAVNLSIDTELVALARESGVNLSALLERALRETLREKREELWREANKAALDAYDRHIERDGLWCDEFRTW